MRTRGVEEGPTRSGASSRRPLPADCWVAVARFLSLHERRALLGAGDALLPQDAAAPIRRGAALAARGAVVLLAARWLDCGELGDCIAVFIALEDWPLAAELNDEVNARVTRVGQSRRRRLRASARTAATAGAGQSEPPLWPPDEDGAAGADEWGDCCKTLLLPPSSYFGALLKFEAAKAHHGVVAAPQRPLGCPCKTTPQGLSPLLHDGVVGEFEIG